jgi:hypothetical protein
MKTLAPIPGGVAHENSGTYPRGTYPRAGLLHWPGHGRDPIVQVELHDFPARLPVLVTLTVTVALPSGTKCFLPSRHEWHNHTRKCLARCWGQRM